MKRTAVKRAAAVMAGLLMVPGLVMALGSGEKSQAEEQGGGEESLTVRAAALNGPSGIGMIRLIADDPDLGEGVTAQYSVEMSPQVMMGKLLDGKVDIAALPVNMPAVLYAKGAPYILGAVTGKGLIYTVSTDHSIQDFTDLEGKTLYTISPNATPDILTRYLLKENGLTPGEDVTLDFSYGHTELAQALIGGLVETASLPEPFITMVTAKNPDLQVVLDFQEEFRRIQGGEETYPITAIAVSRELAEEHPEVLDRFFAEYKKSIEWVNGHPGEAGPLAAEYGFTMPPAVTAASIPRLNLEFQSAQEARPSLEAFFEVLAGVNPKAIGGSLPGDDFYYSGE